MKSECEMSGSAGGPPRGRRLASSLCLAALALAATAVPAAAETAQKGNLRVAFSGRLSPRALPRHGRAPVRVSVGGRIATTDDSTPPRLRRIAIAVNRRGAIDYRDLPRCTVRQVQPATSQGALAACRGALVGEGSFAAAVKLPQQSPFPARGKLLAFNGIENGRPVILAHVYGSDPIPTSFTLPLRIRKSRGVFGTVLTAKLPDVTTNVAFVTGITLRLGRVFRHRGARRGYLSAGCPAPKGFPGGTFPLLRASFSFAGHRTLASTLNRDCRAIGH